MHYLLRDTVNGNVFHSLKIPHVPGLMRWALQAQYIQHSNCFTWLCYPQAPWANQRLRVFKWLLNKPVLNEQQIWDSNSELSSCLTLHLTTFISLSLNSESLLTPGLLWDPGTITGSIQQHSVKSSEQRKSSSSSAVAGSKAPWLTATASKSSLRKCADLPYQPEKDKEQSPGLRDTVFFPVN